MILKHSGDLHPTANFHQLNSITVPDQYTILHIQDFVSSLHRCTAFSKLDLVKAYHQVPVNPGKIPKTAITTPFCAFKFLTMPSGLCNAVNTFQQFIDEVMRNFESVYIYTDKILIASASLRTILPFYA